MRRVLQGHPGSRVLDGSGGSPDVISVYMYIYI